MAKKETDPGKSKRKILILSFVIPFIAIMSIWTLRDYFDISDGLEKGRGGPQPTISNQQIFLNSFKDSFVFAIPAGLIGLGCGLVVFGKSKQGDNSM